MSEQELQQLEKDLAEKYKGIDTANPARFDFETYEMYKMRMWWIKKFQKNRKRGTIAWDGINKTYRR